MGHCPQHSTQQSAGFNACSSGKQIPTYLRDGPFDIQGGGGWDFLEKNSFVSQQGRKK